MELLQFATQVGAALLMGSALGLERQFRGHPAGLRTNTLVCVGAALFVSLSHLLGDRDSPTRVASYIVSGIGFLGGGVILREGFNVRGMNTAATLWCTAAVGTLAGAGFPAHALVGTLTVLAVHLGMRPVGHWVDARRKMAVDVEVGYRIRVVSTEREQGIVRTILLRHVNSHPRLTIQGISTQDGDQPGRASVVAEVHATERSDKAMEDLMRRLDIEPGVLGVAGRSGIKGWAFGGYSPSRRRSGSFLADLPTPSSSAGHGAGISARHAIPRLDRAGTVLAAPILCRGTVVPPDRIAERPDGKRSFADRRPVPGATRAGSGAAVGAGRPDDPRHGYSRGGNRPAAARAAGQARRGPPRRRGGHGPRPLAADAGTPGHPLRRPARRQPPVRLRAGSRARSTPAPPA